MARGEIVPRRALWRVRGNVMNNALRRLMARPWIKYPVETVQRFAYNNGALNSAGLAFFMLLSFAPMILMGVALLSLIVSPAQALGEVHHIVDNLLPAGGAREEANHFLTEKLSGVLLDIAARSGLPFIFGLLSMIWASMQIYVMGAAAMNMAFEVRENRGWLELRVIALGLLIGTALLLLISLFLSGAPSAIKAYQLPIIDALPVGLPVVTVLFEILAVLINAFLFSFVYKFLPAAPNTWRSAAVGGLTASILFEVAKKAIAVFLLRPNHGLYGGLTDLIVFILWIYYSMSILIFGGEVAAIFARYREPSTVGHRDSRKIVTRADRIRRSSRTVE